MVNLEHLEILKRGVEEWNAWRKTTAEQPELGQVDLRCADLTEADFYRANLGGANLGGAKLTRAKLDFAKLFGAKLSGAHLAAADLERADLRSADLRGTYLGSAKLCYANLEAADLHGAELSGSNLGGANLADANFAKTRLFHTIFADCDLSHIRGLDAVRHEGPSTIGLDTIYKSKDKIPESFLRGCGVPDSFITQMRALVNAEDGIQFYSCFISYSTKDEEFATRLHGKMRDAHLRVWYAPEDMPGGKKLHEEIDEAIRIYDKLLIVLSERSLESEWVKTELRKAFKAERESEKSGKKKRKLFPVRLTDMERIKAWSCFDADSGKDLGVELREYFIPDFSHWKDHDQFESSFARLLKDLKAGEKAE